MTGVARDPGEKSKHYDILVNELPKICVYGHLITGVSVYLDVSLLFIFLLVFIRALQENTTKT